MIQPRRWRGHGAALQLPKAAEVARLVEPRGCRRVMALPYRQIKHQGTSVKGAQNELLRARTLTSRYVDEFLDLDGHSRESGLIYIGPPGVGKTHLAVAALLELIRRYRVRGRFVDFTSLIYQIQSTFDASSPESKQSVLDPVIHADVLVLDELGAQKPTPWVSEVLYLVLNTRYTRRLPTLFTTNYGLAEESAATSGGERAGPAGSDELTSRIPAMLVSRLYEMAQPVVIGSQDYRRLVKMHQHREHV